MKRSGTSPSGRLDGRFTPEAAIRRSYRSTLRLPRIHDWGLMLWLGCMLLGWSAAGAEYVAESEPVTIDLSTPEVLTAALADDEVEVRLAAARALKPSRDPRIVEPLIVALGDRNEEVRSVVSEVLGGVRGEPALREIFWRAVGSGRGDMRYRALQQLSRSELVPSLDDARWAVRSAFGPLGLMLGGLGVVFVGVTGFVLQRALRPRRVPGWMGWCILAGGGGYLVLFAPGLRVGPLLPVLLGVGSAPVLALLLASGLVGWLIWSSAASSMRGRVCRSDYHRFVPGPRLGFLERITGRLLVRHRESRAGAAGMVADTVCRARGCIHAHEGIRRVVVVLNAALGAPLDGVQDRTLRVNWLRYRQPFDFQEVEIEEASDGQVEEFLAQARYQSDPLVQRSLRSMECRIGPKAVLTKNTQTLLAAVFGNVVPSSPTR